MQTLKQQRILSDMTEVTAEEAAKRLRAKGISVIDFCRENSVDYTSALRVLQGRQKGLRGKAYQAAKALGINTSVDANEKSWKRMYKIADQAVSKLEQIGVEVQDVDTSNKKFPVITVTYSPEIDELGGSRFCEEDCYYVAPFSDCLLRWKIEQFEIEAELLPF